MARPESTAGAGRAIWWEPPSRVFVPLVALVGAVLSAVVFLTLRASERDSFHAQFQVRAQERISAIEGEFRDAVVIVQALASSLASSDVLDRSRFAQLARQLLDEHDGIHALGYNVPVSRDERAAFEAANRTDPFPDFQIREISPEGRPVPAGPRDEHVVVRFIEPYEGNEGALGLDVASEPVRRRAFETALRTGRPTVTGRIDLVQGAEGFGLLLASPVYRQPRASSAAEGRLPRPDGFAVGVFDIAEIFAAALSHLQPIGIDLRLVDDSADRDRVLHVHPSRTRPEPVVPSFPGSVAPKTHAFEMAGREWRIDARPTEEYLAASRGWVPWVLAGSVLALTLVVAAYLHFQRLLNRRLRRSAEQEHRALEALRVSDRRFRELVDDIDGVVWEAGVPGTPFTFISKRAESLLGYPAEEWLNTPGFWEARLHPEDRDRTLRYTELCTEEGTDHDLEYRAIAADGSIVWIEDVVHVVRDAEGVPRKRRGLMIDISARKRLEEERVALVERSVQSRKMEALGTLATGVAHDVNNALQSIRANTDLLGRTTVEGGASPEAAAAIGAAAEQAARVTKALLTFGRDNPSERIPRRLAAVLEDTAPMITSLMTAAVRVTVEASDPQDPWVALDASRIQQVLLNLAINARDAMPDGGTLRISMETSREGPAGIGNGDTPLGYAVLTFDDTGRGIPEDLKDRVFEPFFTTKPRGQGTGLGLSIAHGIVADHAGAIEIDAAREAGTRIRVWLPRCEPAVEPGDAPADDRPAGGAGVTVLIAEDNEHVRDVLGQALRTLEYHVILTSDGGEFLRELEVHRSRVDILILDVDLPVKEGPACLREARRSGVKAPAILMSGLPASSLEMEDLADVTFVQKPFGLADLDALVRRMLGAAVSRPEGSQPASD